MSNYANRLRAAQLRGNTSPKELYLLEEVAEHIDQLESKMEWNKFDYEDASTLPDESLIVIWNIDGQMYAKHFTYEDNDIKDIVAWRKILPSDIPPWFK
jgi:hypothetical protein